MAQTKATLLGICGKRRAGKDMLARRISLYFPNIKVLKFAGALKGITFLFSGNVNAFTPSGDDNARGLLQKIGEGILTHHKEGNNAFVEMVRALCAALQNDDLRKTILALMEEPDERANQPIYPVITDVRFPHEEQWIHQAGGRIVRITTPHKTPNGALDNHPSEKRTEDVQCDLEIPSETVLTPNKQEFYNKVVRPIAELTGWELLPTPRKPKIFLASNICGINAEGYDAVFVEGKMELEDAGFEVIAPTDLISYDDFLAKLNEMLFLHASRYVFTLNTRAISRSDAVLAILNFPSMGVAIEIMIAYLTEKPVVICAPNGTVMFHPYLWALSHGHIYTTKAAAINALKELFALR